MERFVETHSLTLILIITSTAIVSVMASIVSMMTFMRTKKVFRLAERIDLIINDRLPAVRNENAMLRAIIASQELHTQATEHTRMTLAVAAATTLRDLANTKAAEQTRAELAVAAATALRDIASGAPLAPRLPVPDATELLPKSTSIHREKPGSPPPPET